MKEKMSIVRNKDRDITARQPLLEKSSPKNSTNGPTSTVITSNNQSNNSIGSNLISSAMASRHSGAKYSKLENVIDSPKHYVPPISHATSPYNLDSPTNQFLGETVSIQQRMLQTQDEQLDVLSDSIGTLKTVSRQINVEIDEQAV